jgi:hypothetical protein
MRRPRLSPNERRIIAISAGCCALATLAVRTFVLPTTANAWDTVLWGFEGVMMLIAIAIAGASRQRDRRSDVDA